MNEKKNNQYYGQYFEEAICSIINHVDIPNNTGYSFEAEEIERMNSHANQVAKHIQAKSAVYVGRETSNQNCDIICDEESIEIKYVSTGNGTYFNTSISVIDTIGFESYHSRLLTSGYISRMKEIFGDMISETNLSPVKSAKDASLIKAHKDYRYLADIESDIRVSYVKDFFDFLVKNEEAMRKFIYGLITKDFANKKIPFRIVVFNYEKESILEISKAQVEKMLESKTIRNAGKSLVFDDFRVAFGWQNGNGLRNPTLRVFLS